MSTPNFALANARKYYVITTESYDEDNNYDEFLSQMDYDDKLEYILQSFLDKGWDDSANIKFQQDRSYPEHRLETSKSVCFTYCGIDCEVRLQPIVTSGYYSGANLDYFKEFRMDWRCQGYCCSDYWEDGEIDFDSCFYAIEGATGNKGLAKRFAKYLENKLNKAMESIEDEFDKIAEQCCDEKYRCVGIFSNGEAIYEKAS